jgi:hypothetical protein
MSLRAIKRDWTGYGVSGWPKPADGGCVPDEVDWRSAWQGLEGEVERVLEGSFYAFEHDANLGGLSLDYIVHAPDEDSFIILELKAIAADRSDLAIYALDQARRVLRLVGARRVLIVTPTRIRGIGTVAQAPIRIVPVGQLRRALASGFRAANGGSHPPSSQPSAGKVFAAMPFDTRFDDVFFVAIRGAAEDVGLVAERVDQIEYPGDVMERIKARLSAASVVVTDLTGQRPNVMYEMGWAQGHGIPVVPICADDLAMLPFDVSHEATIKYELGRTTLLRARLAARLKSKVGAAT